MPKFLENVSRRAMGGLLVSVTGVALSSFANAADGKTSVAPKSDREQLQELVATYGFSLDTKDYAGLGNCFTADGKFTFGTNTTSGRDNIVAMLKEALAPWDATQHSYTNFVIDIDGNQARVRSNFLAVHMRNNAPGGNIFTVGGRYNVEAQKTGQKWFISHLTGTSTWMDGNPNASKK